MKHHRGWVAVGLVLALAGCGLHTPRPVSEVARLDQYALDHPLPQTGSLLVRENYQAGQELLYTQARLADDPETGLAPLDPRIPILVTTFVNLDNLDESSSLGRLIPEQIGNRLTQLGYPVAAHTLRHQLAYKKDVGSLILSRDLAKIAHSQNAQAVVTGTYTVAVDRLFVSAKLIRFGEKTTVAGYDYVLPLAEDSRISEPNNLDRLIQQPTTRWTVQPK